MLAAVPLAIAWAWRQTQKARLIDRVELTERKSTANPRWVPVVLLVTAALAMSASVVMIVRTMRADYDAVYGCALVPEDERIRDWWVRHHLPAVTDVGGPCTAHDRPCVVRADRAGATVRLAWHWRIADAFNVSWRAIDGQDSTSVEVAGNEYTITGLSPGTSYVVHVQACDKQFLSSSKCTPSSAYLIAV